MAWRNLSRIVARYIGTDTIGRRIVINGGSKANPVSVIQFVTGTERIPADIRQETGGLGTVERLSMNGTDLGQPKIPALTLSSTSTGSGASLGADAVTLGGPVTITSTLTGSNMAGIVPVSFTSLTSFTTPVVFPVPFTTPPAVMTNINTGNGVAGHWSSRAINITVTGFTMFVFSDSGAVTQTWSGIPVQWIAVGT